MTGERIFLDTWYIVALLTPRDSSHARAKRLFARVRSAAVVITDAVLLEVCNWFARSDRAGAAEFVRNCYVDSRFEVVPIDRALLGIALQEYSSVADKDWSLTDCLSFAVMRQRGMTLVATGDQHFRQAGFQLLED